MFQVLRRAFWGGDEFSGQSWSPWEVVASYENRSDAIDREVEELGKGPTGAQFTIFEV